MKKLLILAAGLLQLYAVSAQVSLTATLGTTSGSYATLKASFDAINAGTHKGVISISITANTAEAASAALNASGSGSASYSSVSISPSGGSSRTITGSIAGALINLNGADNITIDGLNSGGNALIIQNTSTGSTSSALQFINDATSNTITRCTLKGSTTSTTGYGVVTFAAASSGTGNDGNTISYCSVTAAGANLPYVLIGSAGTSGRENSGNTVTYCLLYDYFNASGQDAAILLSGYSTAWTVTNNSIYQTASRSKSSGNTNGIYLNCGDGYTISGNYLGGSSQNCGSTAMTYTGSLDMFHGIEFTYFAAAVNKSTISNNVIRNISITTTNANQSTNSTIPRFSGLFLYTFYADVTGNEIGSVTENNSIVVNCNGGFSLVYPICVAYASTAYIGNFNNNKVGGFTISGTTNSFDFTGITLEGLDALSSFSNNIVGSTTVSNNITGSGTLRSMTGIYFYGGVALNPVVSGNSIMNMTRTVAGSITAMYLGSNVAVDFTNSTISNISISAATGDLYGIQFSVANQKVSKTTIEKLTGPARVYGIYTYLDNSIIERVFISRLNGTTTSSDICGIKIQTSNSGCVVRNSIISLGYDSAGADIPNRMMYGIYLYYAGAILHNTVSIGGSGTSGSQNSIAFCSISNNYLRDIRNNIFSNTRSNNGGTGTHYAVSLPGNTQLTSDYNDYWASGTGGVLGVYAAAAKSTIALWRTATAQDAASVSSAPLFVSIVSRTAVDYLAGAYLPATPIGSIPDDYLERARSATYPTQGAIESNYWSGATSSDFGTGTNWMSGQVPPAGSSVIFVNSPFNHCLLDQDRTIQTYSNRQATYILKTNGHKLTVNGTYELSNGALVDAQNGTIEIAGTGSTTLDYSQYVSGNINNLTINKTGSATVTANATASIAGTLTMTNGVFILGNYSFTAADFSGGSASSYVMTNGSGQLKSTIANTVTRNFPVGNSAYNAVVLTNNTGSADLFGASVRTEVYQNSTDGALINFSHITRTWDISKQNPNGGSGIDITLNWNPGETSGLIVAPVLFHYGSTWQEQNGTFSNTATSLTFNGYTGSFSPFAVAEYPYALPVSWMDITVQKQSGNVQLGWATAFEHDNASFTVEHSTDRLVWNGIGTVTGKGNSTAVNKYAFLHVMPDPGMHYYRISQNDLNGAHHYSKVVAVSMETAKRLAVYPNPVTGNNLQFELPAASRVRFVNQNGIVVWEKMLPAGMHAVQLPQLARGYYILVTETEKVPVILN